MRRICAIRTYDMTYLQTHAHAHIIIRVWVGFKVDSHRHHTHQVIVVNLPSAMEFTDAEANSKEEALKEVARHLSVRHKL